MRDAFADLLFPGTSTIQTVAKYFLFVPWIHLQLEQKRTSAAVVAIRDRKLEIKLARELEESGESEGVIGRIAKEKLHRLPSSIYWQGLHVWGIRAFSGSQDDYHHSLDLFYQRQGARRSSRYEYDGEPAEEPGVHNWHTGLPQPDEDLVNVLDGVLPWWKFHAYLYRGPRTVPDEWLTEEAVREHLAAHDLEELMDAAIPLFLPEELTLSSIEYVENRSLRIIAVQRREYTAREQDLDAEEESEDGETIIYRAWVERVARVMVIFEWQLRAKEAMLQCHGAPENRPVGGASKPASGDGLMVSSTHGV